MHSSFIIGGSLTHVLRRLNQATHLAAPLSLRYLLAPCLAVCVE